MQRIGAMLAFAPGSTRRPINSGKVAFREDFIVVNYKDIVEARQLSPIERTLQLCVQRSVLRGCSKCARQDGR